MRLRRRRPERPFLSEALLAAVEDDLRRRADGVLDDARRAGVKPSPRPEPIRVPSERLDLPPELP